MSNTIAELSADLMGEIDDESKYVKSRTTTFRRVKLEKGESWLVRFLPYAMGEKKMFYARIAQHWYGNKPYVCPRETAAEWGGDADYSCPVCNLAEDLESRGLSDGDMKIVRGFATRPSWNAWVLVYQKDTGKGDPEMISGSDMWEPYEYNMSSTAFDELTTILKRSTRGGRNAAANPLGILDLENGTDIWVTRKQTSYALAADPDGPAPFVSDVDDAEWDRIIAHIWKKCHDPKVTIPSNEELDALARKIGESFDSGGGRAPSSGRGRSRSRGDGGEVADAPPPRRSRQAPPDEDDVPMNYTKEPEPEAAPQRRRRSAPPAAVVETEPEPEPDPDPEDAPPSTRRAGRRSKPLARFDEGVDESEDTAPEEREDPAPASEADFDSDPEVAPEPGEKAPDVKSRLRGNIQRMSRGK